PLGLFAAAPPAGASGTHGVNSATAACFTATGQTQGRSHSDPDGMSNGGADKPGCTGGFDADRDGNNGCGNDTDREDDNNGWCGNKPKPEVVTPPPPGPPPPAPGPGPVVLPAPTPKVEHEKTLARTGIDPSELLFAGWGFVLTG